MSKLLGRGKFGKVVLAKRKLAGGTGSNQNVFAVKTAKIRGRNIELEVFNLAVGYPFLVQLLLIFQTKVLCSFLNVHIFRQLLILQTAISINM